MQNTTHYNLKKPDYTDFADIQDINDNMDTIDEKLAAPDGDGRDQTVSFTDADLDTGITSFPTFLSKIVSGMKMAKFLRDFKAGMAYVLHVGNLVNNATCTESGKALDARMGKTLQDQITSLNDSFTKLTTERVVQCSITDAGLIVSNQGIAYFHVPLRFRFALLLCRFVTYNNVGYWFLASAYINYLDTAVATILDKSGAIQNISFVHASDGTPTFVVTIPGYENTRLISCDLTILAQSIV